MDLRTDERYSELARILRDAGFPEIPHQLPAEGLVADNPIQGALGIWMMPDNRSEGMTETFAAHLLEGSDDPAWSYAQRVVAEMPEGARRFDATRHSDKANVHTWLAWQQEPDGSLGNAIRRGDMAVNGELAVRFCRWVEQWVAAGSGGLTE